MKKNIDKLIINSLETYAFLLVLIFIIKLLGGNYFEFSFNNKSLLLINDFILKYNLENIWYTITLYIYSVIMTSITCNDNSKNIKRYCLYILPVTIILQYTKNFTGTLGIIIDIFYLLFLSITYLKIFKKEKIKLIYIKNYVMLVILNLLFQSISMITRSQSLNKLSNIFYVNVLLNIDYFLMLIMLYKYYFMKGVSNLCQTVAFSGLQKLDLLKDSHAKLQRKSQNKKTKEERITCIIYYPLYILWNLFTMLVIIIIAMLNEAFIEAIFITISFWINKRVFGKPFHFKSVAICFCFSSIVYYVLTRITFKISTSLFVPIFLGVTLSYVTANMVKEKTKKRLYRGIPEEDFYELINKVTDDKLIIKMCKEYYCDREKEIKVASKNGYSVESLQKKKKKINDLIKELEE